MPRDDPFPPRRAQTAWPVLPLPLPEAGEGVMV